MRGRDPINSTLAISSLRSQGFSPISAIYEIIDNSVEAKAKNIQILLEYREKEPGQIYERMKKFIFTDDGDGMDEKLLYDCLVLGESTRRANSRGIGKFGVGATFSGISQGKRIEIYSKTKGSRWMYTFFDLDSLENDEGIPKPVPKEPPVKDLPASGTVVLWNKIDRSAFTRNDEKSLFEGIGRTYRKFLTNKRIENGKLVNNNPVKISINNEYVIPYDPLFITHNRRKADNVKPKYESKSFDIGAGSQRTKMWITSAYLPETWWDTPAAGNKKENTHERYITDRNEGISIVREGREVLFGDIPYFKLAGGGPKNKFVEVDRWTSFEVAFNRDADELFEVQNNKSRLIISSSMRDEIARAITPTIRQRRELIDKVRKQKKPENADEDDESSTIITDVIGTPPYGKKEKGILTDVAKKLGDSAEEHERILKNLMSGFYRKFVYDMDKLGPFVTYEYHLNSLVMKYNMNHPFMKNFIDSLNSIEEEAEETPANLSISKNVRDMRILFEALMASFGFAKSALENSDRDGRVEQTTNSLMINWGNFSQQCAIRYSKLDS